MNKIKPFFVGCCANPYPTAYDESLSYYEEVCKIAAKLNEVINSQNNLQTSFEQIMSWVNTQLKTYTIEQLQNWLDDGTLENLINISLFNKKISQYQNVADMVSDTDLTESIVCYTCGYYQANDGGDCHYIIETNSSTFSIKLNNNLYATPLLDELNIKKIGAKGDGINDDGQYIQKFIDYANAQPSSNFGGGYNIVIPAGKYLVSQSFTINQHNIIISGKGKGVSILMTSENFNDTLFTFKSSNGKTLYYNGIRDITLHTVRYDDEHTPKTLLLDTCNYFTCENVAFISAYDGIDAIDCGKLRIENVDMLYNEDVSMNEGIFVSGSDIHITNTQVLPSIYKYLKNALRIGFSDGVYISNLHTEGRVTIDGNQKNGSEIKAINIQIVNSYLDRSQFNSLEITNNAENGIRNITISNTSIYGDVNTNGIVFNTNVQCGLIILSNILFGNCKVAIQGSQGSDILVSNSVFNNSTNNDIFVKGRFKIFNCIFKNTNDTKISAIDSTGSLQNQMIALNDLKDSKVTSAQLTNIYASGNVIVNNLNSNI